MDWTGLAAATWDYFIDDSDQEDCAFFRSLIAAKPGPALDVGCGTGRLMLSYLASGLEVEGIDTSEEMLAICREKARQRGLIPVLYRGRMQRLDLRRKYATIFIHGGSFQLVVDRDEALETLRRFYAHLELGGVVAISLDDPWEEMIGDAQREWRDYARSTRPSDGAEILQYRLMESVDRVEQVRTELLRYAVVRQGSVVQEETHRMRMRVYFKYEFALMLEKAGFRAVEVDSSLRIFTAKR